MMKLGQDKVLAIIVFAVAFILMLSLIGRLF
jgi:hypothetical protein